MEAWHWVSADKMTRYAPRVPVIVGETLRVDPPVVLCERGLHASVRALDALQYALGPIICRVQLGGEIKHGDDKLVSTERTVLWMYDATNVLHEFACRSAETALLIAQVEDARCWGAIEVKRAWLRGEASDSDLAAARDAAWDAARSAAGAAQAATLRDIVGTPHRPYHVRWAGGPIPSLAHAAYDSRDEATGHLDPARLAVLADALEEAGCDAECETCEVLPTLPGGLGGVIRMSGASVTLGGDARKVYLPGCRHCGGTGRRTHPLLAHLRSPGPHVRGCWAVDAVLGRE
jgi:hypothetical protein